MVGDRTFSTQDAAAISGAIKADRDKGNQLLVIIASAIKLQRAQCMIPIKVTVSPLVHTCILMYFDTKHITILLGVPLYVGAEDSMPFVLETVYSA